MPKFIYTTAALSDNQHLVKIDSKDLVCVYCQGYTNGKRDKTLDGYYFKSEVRVKLNNLPTNF